MTHTEYSPGASSRVCNQKLAEVWGVAHNAFSLEGALRLDCAVCESQQGSCTDQCMRSDPITDGIQYKFVQVF